MLYYDCDRSSEDVCCRYRLSLRSCVRSTEDPSPSRCTTSHSRECRTTNPAIADDLREARRRLWARSWPRNRCCPDRCTSLAPDKGRSGGSDPPDPESVAASRERPSARETPAAFQRAGGLPCGGPGRPAGPFMRVATILPGAMPDSTHCIMGVSRSMLNGPSPPPQ